MWKTLLQRLPLDGKLAPMNGALLVVVLLAFDVVIGCDWFIQPIQPVGAAPRP